MNGSLGNLRLYPGELSAGADSSTDLPPLPESTRPLADATVLAGRELIRPAVGRRADHRLAPFSAAWFDELEQKRYTRHGAWLPAALEFGRHPGESVLLLNPGLGCDAVRYLREGSEVTVAAGPTDHPDSIRGNLARHGLTARVVRADGPTLSFPDGTFDVAVLNALHTALPADGSLTDELFRVLKSGGKVIGLFPAYYDTGLWQDWLLPYQRLYWRRPPDPTTAPKTTARGLRRAFARFAGHRIYKRHLRRGELPHAFRILPLVVLERLFGRVLVLKAFRPIGSRTATMPALPADSLAA